MVSIATARLGAPWVRLARCESATITSELVQLFKTSLDIKKLVVECQYLPDIAGRQRYKTVLGYSVLLTSSSVQRERTS